MCTSAASGTAGAGTTFSWNCSRPKSSLVPGHCSCKMSLIRPATAGSVTR
ncbi:Uncharacterised protein [Mycobacteroides abscessus subsp. abscessus]|nr:Uncharacterised protein [Mycobacteroides abscessus subsp. abscessus]